MPISKNRQDRDRAAYEENASDGGVDRRVNIKNPSDEPIPVFDSTSGTTVSFTGTATTTPVNVPAAADKIITGAGILRDSTGSTLEVSFDNGTTFFTLEKTDSITWDVKGDIKQLKFKTSSGSVAFRVLINFLA